MYFMYGVFIGALIVLLILNHFNKYLVGIGFILISCLVGYMEEKNEKKKKKS